MPQSCTGIFFLVYLQHFFSKICGGGNLRTFVAQTKNNSLTMKKLLLLVAIATMAFTANAQIKIQESFTNDLIIIGNLSGGKAVNVMSAMNGSADRVAEHKLYCRIFHEKTTYGILADTENRFDDDFEFALGTDIQKARESIETILKFMETNPLKTSLGVEDEDGRTIQINLLKRNVITLKAIDAQGAVIVDDVRLQRSNLERALKLLDNKAERKVAEAIAKNNQ